MAKKIYPVAKSPGQNQKRKQRVLVGTPALDGRVDAWYSYALHEIGKLGLLNDIEVNMVLLSYESILPMARNELLTAAIQGDFDSLVFIDSDVYCDPQAFIDIVKSEKDVAAIPTVKKSDQESYDIFFKDKPKQEGNWIKADAVSTSCLKLSKKVLKELASNSTKTTFRGKELHNICQYDFVANGFIGEDIYLCQKIKQLGFDIWVNIASTCMHVGPKVYVGDFKKLLNNDNIS
jgi:hypothetical protein